MKTIWKFELKVGDKVSIEMPQNSEILSVQTQRGIPCIWALVDPNEEKEERYFEIFGTGHPIYYDIGTFQMSDGGLIFHLFERI